MDILNIRQIGVVALRLAVAILLGGIIGVERSRDRQNAGMRTYMLVSAGAATAMLTGEFLFLKYGTGDPARIGAQVVSGIGFLGAGSIIVSNRSMALVKGLTTAAGLWASACIGLAAGCGFYAAAVIATLMVYLIMKHLRSLEYRIIRANREFAVFMELSSDASLSEILDNIKKCDLEIKKFQIEDSNSESTQVTLILKSRRKRALDEIYKILNKIPGVNKARSIY